MTNLLHSEYTELARELLMLLHYEDLASIVKTATGGRIAPADTTEACTAILLSCPDVAKLLSHRKLSSVFLLQYLTLRGVVIRGHATRMQLVMAVVQHWEQTVKSQIGVKQEEAVEKEERVLYTMPDVKQEPNFEPECRIKEEPNFEPECRIKEEPDLPKCRIKKEPNPPKIHRGPKFTNRVEEDPNFYRNTPIKKEPLDEDERSSTTASQVPGSSRSNSGSLHSNSGSLRSNFGSSHSNSGSSRSNSGSSHSNSGSSPSNFGSSHSNSGSSPSNFGSLRSNSGSSRSNSGSSRSNSGPSRSNSGPSRSNSGSSRSNSGSSRSDFGPSRSDFGPSRSDFGPLRSNFTEERGHETASSVTSPATSASTCVNKFDVETKSNGQVERIMSDEFATDFCVWFYMMVNKLQPCCSDQAGDSLRPEIFCGNCCLEMYLVDGDRVEQCKASNNAECNNVMRELLSKLGLLFMPNTEGGIHVKKSSHGIIQVSCCGTIHCNDSFVGIFEQEFGLVTSPVDRTWKIAYSKINLKKLLKAYTPSLPPAEVFAIEY